jgi:formylglycine-generating enzyme required for sulfatase activity
VAWYEAVAFCHWVTDVNSFGLEIYLPSEYQWIAAATVGKHSIYLGGDKYSPYSCHIGEISTCPVGCYPPNELGLYDVCGNAAQWTLSEWQRRFGRTDIIDFDTPNITERTIRGCGFSDHSPHVGRRESALQDTLSDTVGFRVCARPKSNAHKEKS